MTAETNDELITALYCRLSVEDEKDKRVSDNESNSISNQKQILLDYCKNHGYKNTMFFVDDGISGTSFERSDFQRMQRMAEEGKICRIIVKDLSRFGREQVEAGRLTQIVYPSLGITFISIQENVNSTTGDGMEMLPFYNIFNEWYAAQTSKKIRAVWQSKAEHGKRVSATVPFGYMKSPDNKEQWIIDEPAATIVRKIYSLCLAGRGPLQIAKQLEKENILIPSAYYESIGRKHTQKVPCDSCKWDQKTVVNILENRQYTGCAVNFKSTTVSYKVHKVIHNPTEEYQIIPNMQEPIISEEQWLRVQELRKHRRRPTATGRQSLFSGLVYCPDCGAKLHFCAAKSLKRNQEFWRCSNYKSGRGECPIHYIRDISLEQIVLESIRSLADFVKCYESAFLYMLAKKTNLVRQTENKKLRLSVERGGKRISEIDKLIEKVFEQNAAGILSDERFSKLLQNYECEQKRLQTEIEEWKAALDDVGQKVTDLRLLLHTLREITEIKELTPTLINTLIERIEVHNNDKSSGHCYVKVDVYFTAVGMIDIPTEQEILAMMEEMQKNNVISIIKHFPGHGITKKDSHILLPYTFNYKEVLNKHILPFKEAIDNGCDGIMISHIVIRKLTQGLPSSLSKKLIKEYLREKLHYDNLVITDDIRMKPVDLLYKSVSLKKAFTSGADIILFKYRKDDYKVINKVIKMVKTGKIKEEDIDKSVARILRIKEKYNISDKKKINGCNIEELNKQIEELNSILN